MIEFEFPAVIRCCVNTEGEDSYEEMFNQGRTRPPGT